MRRRRQARLQRIDGRRRGPSLRVVLRSAGVERLQGTKARRSSTARHCCDSCSSKPTTMCCGIQMNLPTRRSCSRSPPSRGLRVSCRRRPLSRTSQARTSAGSRSRRRRGARRTGIAGRCSSEGGVRLADLRQDASALIHDFEPKLIEGFFIHDFSPSFFCFCDGVVQVGDLDTDGVSCDVAIEVHVKEISRHRRRKRQRFA